MGSGTALGRVRGLGAAHAGVEHWWRQKLTAGSNFALLAWLMVSLTLRPSFGFTAMREWIASPWAAVPMMLLIVSVFSHFRLGLQTVIEDYQHDQSRVVAMVLLNFFVFATAATAIFSILKIAFGASA